MKSIHLNRLLLQIRKKIHSLCSGVLNEQYEENHNGRMCAVNKMIFNFSSKFNLILISLIALFLQKKN